MSGFGTFTEDLGCYTSADLDRGLFLADDNSDEGISPGGRGRSLGICRNQTATHNGGGELPCESVGNKSQPSNRYGLTTGKPKIALGNDFFKPPYRHLIEASFDFAEAGC